MSRYSRHQSVINREADLHIDEDNWLNQFQKNLEKNAVQSRKVDQQLFHQINSIMNNKSKYTSVSAAVEDMMMRSGLTDHLKNFNKTSQDNSQQKNELDLLYLKMKKCLKDENWFECGKVAKEICDMKGSNIVNILDEIENDIPKHNWLFFATGFSDGLDESKKEEILKLVNTELSKMASHHSHSKYKNYKRVDDKELNEKAQKMIVPIVIKKVPSILKTIENYINDTKGNLPVPAILEKIKSIHSKDVSDARDWEDVNFIKLISDKNLKAKSQNFSHDNHYNLGVRDTSSLDANDSNTDAFQSLMPAKL